MEEREDESTVVSAPLPEEKSHRGGQIQAVKGSGETLRYSEIGHFPITNTPEGYQRVRRAFNHGDFRQARALLEKLITNYPKSANTNYVLGTIYFEQGKLDDARTYFEKASSLDHDPQIQSWSREYLKRINNQLRE